MSNKVVTDLVRRYFEEHPDEDVRPRPLVAWVGKERGIDNQSAGSVRAAVVHLVSLGLVEQLDGSPLRYRRRGGERE